MTAESENHSRHHHHAGRHIYFRYNATSGCVGDDVVEPLDNEYMDVALEFCF